MKTHFEFKRHQTADHVQRGATPPKKMRSLRDWLWREALSDLELPETNGRFQVIMWTVANKLTRDNDPLLMKVPSDTTFNELIEAIILTAKYWSVLPYNSETTVKLPYKIVWRAQPEEDVIIYFRKQGDRELPPSEERRLPRPEFRGPSDSMLMDRASETESAEDILIASETLAQLPQWLEQLSPRAQQAIRATFYDGLNREQLGKSLGVCASQASRIYTMSLEQLQRLAGATITRDTKATGC